MAGLGRDLVVNLAGNNAKLKSTIAESKGGLKSFASAATSFLNPITAGFAVAAAGAASAGVAVYMFAGKISELAGIADQAAQTGLSGAFLQRLGYAADQSGVSLETLTGGIKKLTVAIGKGDAKPFEKLGINFSELKAMNPEQQFKTIAEAIGKLPTAAARAAAAVSIFGKSGIEMTGLFSSEMTSLKGGIEKLAVTIGKGDINAFASIGVSLSELKGMNPEQQFKTVAEAISKLPTEAERAAAALAIFGSSGSEITGLLAGGMTDLNLLLGEAASLGIGVSDEGLARAADADDAIQRMKATFGGLIDQMTVGVAPLFKNVTDYITSWIPPITEFIGKFNGLDNKLQFLGDLLAAGFDVGIETIKEHWDTMLADLIKQTGLAALDIATRLTPVGFVSGLVVDQFMKVGSQQSSNSMTPLQSAQERLSNVTSQLESSPSTVAAPSAPSAEVKPPTPESFVPAISSLFGGLAESATSIFGEVSQAVQTEFTGLTMQGGWLGSVVQNAFGVGPASGKKNEAKPESDLKFASAMQKGSSEAFQTIMSSMGRGKKDPNVTATEKQTAALLKGLKPVAPQFAPEFE